MRQRQVQFPHFPNVGQFYDAFVPNETSSILCPKNK